MDPEIFIDQKVLKTYLPTSEPIAAIFSITRIFKKNKIENIVKSEIVKGKELYNSKFKLKSLPFDIEMAKIEFSRPKSLFHCLFLNTLITKKISFQDRINWVISEYKKILKSRISLYKREVIRENFINGVKNTIYLYLLTYPVHEDEFRHLTIDEKELLTILQKLKILNNRNTWKGNTKNPNTEISVLGVFLKKQKLVNPNVNDKDLILYLGNLFKEKVTKTRYSQVKNDLFPKENDGKIDCNSKHYPIYQQFSNDIKL